MAKNEDSTKKVHPKAVEAEAEIHLEDKLIGFWKKNRRHIVLIVLFALMVSFGYLGLSSFRAYKVEQFQDQFREAREKGEALLFAKSDPREPLSGVEFLSEADRLFEQGKFDEAKEFYNLSTVALAKTDLAGRGQLGVALCDFSLDNNDTGYSVLEKLKNNKSLMGVIRAEAAYWSAVMDLKSGDAAKSKATLDDIAVIPDAGIWAQKAIILKETTPELS